MAGFTVDAGQSRQQAFRLNNSLLVIFKLCYLHIIKVENVC